MDVKQELIKSLKKVLPKDVEFSDVIEVPNDELHGDFALPCFFLAKKMKKSPADIAAELKDKIKLPKIFSKVVNVGPYLNFYLDDKLYAELVLSKVLKEKDEFGRNNLGKSKKVVVEYSSPNVAKVFGIGHLRSTLIGNAIANIYEANGYRPVRMNYLGDWGTPFGKILYGYEKFGNEKKLMEDPAKHLYEIYVKVSKDEENDEIAREYFKRLVEGDKELVKKWKLFKELSIKEYKKIYEILGVKFDVYSGESEYNDKMDDVVELLKKKKLVKKDQGALIVDLEKEGLGVALIQKGDGTSLYLTRDLAAAIDRYNKYKFVSMIYEVGAEQSLHFKQLFKILSLLGFKWADKCKHVSHGLYLDKDGKKFATRKGKTIFMKGILDETISLAKKSVLEQGRDVEDVDKTALLVARAAIIYGDLKNHHSKDVIFDIEKFLQFSGNTGPYLLYTYARANSIVEGKKSGKLNVDDLTDEEIRLIKKIGEFGDIVKKALNELSPAIISHYSYELAQLFNEFYHSCKVIGSENESFRVNLVKAFMIVLKSSLSLLGIDVVKRM